MALGAQRVNKEHSSSLYLIEIKLKKIMFNKKIVLVFYWFVCCPLSFNFFLNKKNASTFMFNFYTDFSLAYLLMGKHRLYEQAVCNYIFSLYIYTVRHMNSKTL